MELSLYQIDAFTNKIFHGNPAAVCPLDSWLDDDVMQAIAQENHLSETAFFIPNNSAYDLRWFTPSIEIDFCGHATLAAAYVLFECLAYKKSSIVFNTQLGELRVSKEKEYFIMDFPRIDMTAYAMDEKLVSTFGVVPDEILIGADTVVVLPSEQAVIDYQADFELLKKLPGRGVSITAKGKEYDFVSRFFAPKAGINEDPVTGSAHCALAPYWSHKLNKKQLSARQVSFRGGDVFCLVGDERVTLRGQAVKYLQGTITI